MGKEILRFAANEIEKKKFYHYKMNILKKY